MEQETKAPRGKVWCVGVTYPQGKYIPHYEHSRDAPSRRFKYYSQCLAECEKMNIEKQNRLIKTNLTK